MNRHQNSGSRRPRQFSTVSRRRFLRGVGVGDGGLPWLNPFPARGPPRPQNNGNAGSVFPKKRFCHFCHGHGIKTPQHWWAARVWRSPWNLARCLQPMAPLKSQDEFHQLPSSTNTPTGVGDSIRGRPAPFSVRRVASRKGRASRRHQAWIQVLAHHLGGMRCNPACSRFASNRFRLPTRPISRWPTVAHLLASASVPPVSRWNLSRSLAFDSLFDNRGSRRPRIAILDRVQEQAAAV